jgi:hypothetical protein
MAPFERFTLAFVQIPTEKKRRHGRLPFCCFCATDTA